MKKSYLIILLIILFLIGASARLLPHPANFSPVLAIAMFAGVYLPKKWSIILPAMLMLVTDLFIGFYDFRLMLAVYGSIFLCGLIGIILKKRKNLINIISASLGTALLFFLATNLAVWAFSSWYPHNWQGLLLNYSLAVPFFKNNLFGNAFYTVVLFGGFELIRLKFYRAASIQESAGRSR